MYNLIKDPVISKGIKILYEDERAIIVISLGANPVRGGRPPKDRRRIIKDI